MSCKPSWVDSSKEFNHQQTEKELIRLKRDLPKIIGTVFEYHYDMHRRGAFDFPDKKKWVKDEVHKWFLNYAEDFGLWYKNKKLL